MSETPEKYLHWVDEAMWVMQEPRSEMWRDCEMFDGGDAQWTDDDWNKAINAGIDPLTINRTFPAVNLILGTEAIQRFDIVAKGRTQKDSETGQIMTEAIKFVMDQSSGEYLIAQAFKDAVIPGFGVISPCFESDPRKERLRIKYRDWKEIWWDPFSRTGPWFTPESCKYLFLRTWIDVEDLQALFPEKKKEIEDHYEQMASDSFSGSAVMDEADEIEQNRRVLSGAGWVDSSRKRVRPCELWHPEWKRCVFAKFRDGRVIEITDDMGINESWQILTSAQEVLPAVVRKMHVTTFMGKLILVDIPTPYPHDEYPFVPFVGYVDRNGYPYGVPRQIRGEDEEVNFRRSVSKAALLKRRVTIEDDIVADGQPGLDRLFEEANKLDGFIVVKPGAVRDRKIEIVDNVNLMEANAKLAQISERSIQEITGANNPAMGYTSQERSGVALQEQKRQATTILSPLFDNLQRSIAMVGEQTIANIQGTWTGEKILRITDRLTGAEKFVELNKYISQGGAIEIKNDITQGKYDCVVSESPMTDTSREMYVNLITEWVKKSPPEVIPHLMITALELSNLPNMDRILERLKPVLGIMPDEEELSPEELKQRTIEKIESQQAEEAKMKEMAEADQMSEIDKKRAETEKLMAQVQEILNKITLEQDKLAMEKEAHATSQFQEGMNIGERIVNPQPQEGNNANVQKQGART